MADQAVRADRAATTGWLAANTLLGNWGLAGHPLRSVPNHGRIPLLDRLRLNSATVA